MSEPMPSADPTAIVVRGGAAREAHLVLETLRRAVESGDGPVLSVCVDVQRPDESLHDTLHRICDIGKVPHAKIQVSSVGFLEAIGVTIVPYRGEGEAENHHHATFREPLELEQVVAFIESCEGPIGNPTGGNKRRDAR